MFYEQGELCLELKWCCEGVFVLYLSAYICHLHTKYLVLRMRAARRKPQGPYTVRKVRIPSVFDMFMAEQGAALENLLETNPTDPPKEEPQEEKSWYDTALEWFGYGDEEPQQQDQGLVEGSEEWKRARAEFFGGEYDPEGIYDPFDERLGEFPSDDATAGFKDQGVQQQEIEQYNPTLGSWVGEKVGKAMGQAIPQQMEQPNPDSSTALQPPPRQQLQPEVTNDQKKTTDSKYYQTTYKRGTPEDKEQRMTYYNTEEARFDNPEYYKGAEGFEGVYDKLVDNIVGRVGGDARNVRSFVNMVRFHESGATGMDSYGARQIVDGGAGGVGKGGYMYGQPGFALNADGSIKRPAPGDKHPTEVAQTRYNAMANKYGWPPMKLTNEQIMDSRKIPPAMQDLLFLADKYQDENSKFADVARAKPGSWSATWADSHWKGDAADRPVRIESFIGHDVFPTFAYGGSLGSLGFRVLKSK